MKKILIIITTYIFIITLFGCENNNSKIVISEVIHSSKLIALELYNTTNKDITLKNYKINIYSNGNTEIDYEIELAGKIEANGFYIITYGNTHSDSNIVSITDLFSTDLKYNGNDTIELTYKNKTLTTFGEIGVNIDYGTNTSVVKKTEYLKESKYNAYHYIKYNSNINYLNSLTNPLKSIDLLEGPKITDDDLNKPFISSTNSEQGGGGVITVRLAGCGDGDTASFYFPEYLNFRQGEKVRFLNIDTRETMSHMTQEWGLPAKNYVCDRLKSAKKIQIKSEENHPLREGYGRLWGWIFVDDKLLNLEVAQRGYTDVHTDENITSSYMNITYNNYLLNAYNYAKSNKLGLFGELDPYWDYQNNKPKR